MNNFSQVEVSVIMPAYNAEKYIYDSILSVQKQTFINWELIIIDDNSDDLTTTVVKEFTLTDERIRLIQHKQNFGAAVSRNTGISIAKGRFIAFLDSDDLWLPEKLVRQISFMKKNNFCFTFTPFVKIFEDGTRSQPLPVPKFINYRGLLKNSVIGCLTVIYDAGLLGKIYMPSNTSREDYATWLKILKKIDYAYSLNEVLSEYRVHLNQSSNRKISMAFETFKLFKDVESLNTIHSLYFFIHYVSHSLQKNYLPWLYRLTTLRSL